MSSWNAGTGRAARSAALRGAEGDAVAPHPSASRFARSASRSQSSLVLVIGRGGPA
jgi:hypothetical protein